MTSMAKQPYLVINGYLFIAVPEDALDTMRDQIYDLAFSHGMHGTVLLTPEGINVALCGLRESTEAVMKALIAMPYFHELTFKCMPHDTFIFRRLIVKVKSQIIVFDDKEIDPNDEDNGRILPQELKQLLDQDPNSVVLLDARNSFEIEFGTFKNAESLPVRRFRGFCEALAHDTSLSKDAPIVTFCTGGVRCEKVVPYMRKQGFTNVRQLEGGIFKYFEKVGGDHWQGECFVFDYRTALNTQLEATGTVQCRVCYGPVSPEQQKSSYYQPGVSCPRCHKDVKVA